MNETPLRADYEPPYDQMDPYMAGVCRRINESGWVWTYECCDGHPEQAGERNRVVPGGLPYLRLLTHDNNAARLIRAIEKAAPVEYQVEHLPRVIPHIGLFSPPWLSLTVYVEPLPGYSSPAKCRAALAQLGELIATPA